MTSIPAMSLNSFAENRATESALSLKTKKQRFEEQKHKDVFPDEISEELPQDKGIQHEIDLVPGTKYCVTRQWPLPREYVKAIDDFFESCRNAGQVRKSKSPLSTLTFSIKMPQGGWRIVHAYNKLNDATVPAQTPIPRGNAIIDSMAKSTIYYAVDLHVGFYQILMRESDIALTARHAIRVTRNAARAEEFPSGVQQMGDAFVTLEARGCNRENRHRDAQSAPPEVG
ncbi:Reverse transcriptase [Phytophthora palmivora]|uniref:Reverse transcriptase n=1 Tax=Phytophthora palmivora TaxID=4796 RepID=A0A2P4XWA6_9STRA|nr:Reverse transcriptase [Phytophthora palmivora]